MCRFVMVTVVLLMVRTSGKGFFGLSVSVPYQNLSKMSERYVGWLSDPILGRIDEK